jgi:hypothetical protein
MNIREQAIAYLVGKIRDIDAESTATSRQARAAIPGCDGTVGAILDLTDTADLHWEVATLAERLAEEITGGLLFDRLDSEDAEEQASINPPTGLSLIEGGAS